VRVWDLDPSVLCRQHLLGEHREIHAIFSILYNGKKGYRNHPEVRRWEGYLQALRIRHDRIAGEMVERGYRHASEITDGPNADQRRDHGRRVASDLSCHPRSKGEEMSGCRAIRAVWVELDKDGDLVDQEKGRCSDHTSLLVVGGVPVRQVMAVCPGCRENCECESCKAEKEVLNAEHL